MENRIITTQTDIRDKVFTRSTVLSVTQSSRQDISFRSEKSEKARRNDYQITTVIVTTNLKKMKPLF